ncbi:hypothetical protein I3760_01G228100 [Carya illinoinensis]|uniref:Histidine-containing phosphotransfer protein n=2 Tax=Carya illinoinensis TaxID=32201 RepID=A0A8T1RRD0_CARIL|nr:hypothetical protein I3760_01G228100 [Carya illinoinensis]KAG6669256.1 hypothetical protein CIPAW_01G231500 [Carya illinoinensis]KAG6733609.1 hypothetical protein I3842_01G232700 [Carya illinoinensis]
MDRNRLARQVALQKQSLFDQGYIDQQFIQVEELQDVSSPNFVEEIVTSYYQDTSRLIVNIEQALERRPLDFDQLDRYIYQLNGRSTSFGARKVIAEGALFREYCEAENAEGCKTTFQQLKTEYATLKRKLEAYFQLARQARLAETASRPM